MSLSVEKYFKGERSERVNNFLTREEKFRICKRPCNILFITLNTSEIPNRLNFAAKGPIYYVPKVTGNVVGKSHLLSHSLLIHSSHATDKM